MDIRGAFIKYVYLWVLHLRGFQLCGSTYAVPLTQLLSLYAFPTSKRDMSGWTSEGHSEITLFIEVRLDIKGAFRNYVVHRGKI